MKKPDNVPQSPRHAWWRALAALGAVAALLVATATPASAVVPSSPDRAPTFNGTVWSVAYAGNTIYIGGDFTAAYVDGRQVSRTRLAAVDATTGALLSWAPKANGRVKAIAAGASSIYIAGDFTTVDGLKRDSLARLDASSGAVRSSFRHAISGRPYALAAHDGRLYLGGAITSVNGQVRTRLAAFDLVSGALDSTWKPTVDDQVEVITAAGSAIYVGGKFHRVNGVSGYDRLVALSPSSGSIIGTFKPRASVIAYGIAVTSDGVYSAHGGRGGRVNAYTTSGSLRWSAAFDGDAQAVFALGSTVYVGGHFDDACRTTRTGDQGTCLDGGDTRIKLAALEAADGDLRSWKADANGIEGVLTMAGHAGLDAVAAGGAFTAINGVSRKRFVQFS